MTIEDQIDELFRRVEKLEKRKSNYGYMPIIPGANLRFASSCTENVYHRTCRQLKEHLLEHNIPITSVSRSSVGKKTYYNLQFDLSKEEYSVRDVSTYKIANLFDIKGVGLVEYRNDDDSYHMIYLVDEKELNNKYLRNGNLNFTKQNI